jgi:hypothetical protein
VDCLTARVKRSWSSAGEDASDSARDIRATSSFWQAVRTRRLRWGGVEAVVGGLGDDIPGEWLDVDLRLVITVCVLGCMNEGCQRQMRDDTSMVIVITSWSANTRSADNNGLRVTSF